MTQAVVEDELTELYDFFQNAPIGVQFLRPDGTIRFANGADLRITAYADAPEGYLGRDFSQFHAEPATADAIRDAWGSGRPVLNLHATLRRSDGSPCAVVIHAAGRIVDGEPAGGVCFTFPQPAGTPEPLAASEPAHEALATKSDAERRELRDLLIDAFENAPIGLHIVGPDGLVRRANRIELETLGYADEPAAYVGHHIEEFHAEQAVIDDMLERLIGGRPLTHYRATLRLRDGETMPVVIYSSPRFDGGEFVNTRCFTFAHADAAPDEAPSFGWPRNDEAGPAAAAAGEMTSVLQRLAGRKHAEESLGFLAATSEALAGAGDHRDGLRRVCRLAVPFLADACAVEVAEHGAAQQLVAAGDGGAADAGHALRAAFATRDGVAGAVVLGRGRARPAFGAADAALAAELARRVAATVECGRLRERLATEVS